MNKWQTYKIKDLTQSFSGGTPLTDRPEFYQNGDIPFITSSDLNQQFIDSVPHYITKQGLESSSAKIVEPQTLLLALYGATAGTAAITHIRGAINQAILAFSKSKIDIKFLYYLLSEKKPYILHTYTQGGQPNLSAQIVNNLSIYIPTDCHEQQKIVEVLETWDKAIQLTRKLIEQKELQKKYLMQQLLTGRTRLKGFVTPWRKTILGNLLKEKSLRNKDLAITRVLSVTNDRGFVLPQEQFSRQVASKNVSNYKVVLRGEFAYNPSRINVGSISFLATFEFGILSPMYVVFSCSEQILPQYFKYWIKTYEFISKVKNAAQGSVRATVDFQNLSTIKMNYPANIKEQLEISKVLSQADKEIDLLRQKLAKLEEQKKGLMQVLLTGKVRLQVEK